MVSTTPPVQGTELVTQTPPTKEYPLAVSQVSQAPLVMLRFPPLQEEETVSEVLKTIALQFSTPLA